MDDSRVGTIRGRIIDARDATDGVELVILAAGSHVGLLVARTESAFAVGDLVRSSTSPASAPDRNRATILRVGDAAPTEALALERVGGVASGTFDVEGDPVRWQRARQDGSRMDVLFQRQTISRAIRAYFHREDFLEADVPLLIRGTCPDLAIDSIRAEGGYMTSSTEYQIKRMMVGGFERVFTLTQNFRRGEVSDVHNPEFTMLEWARAYRSLEAIEADVEAFVLAAHDALGCGAEPVIVRGHSVCLHETPWRRLTVRDALAQHLGLSGIDEMFSLESVRASVRAAKVEVPERFLADRFDALSYLLVLLQPHLGLDVPVFLKEWPAFMTSSAGLVPGKPQLAERSELFIAGLEIADGFPFLTNHELQARLFREAVEARVAEGKERVDVDHVYLDALRLGLPPGAGMALGFDRLVMVLTGREHIRDVLAFAWDER